MKKGKNGKKVKMQVIDSDDCYDCHDGHIASRIRIAVQDVIEVEVESNELSFADLKKEAFKIFKFAKENRLNTKPNDNEVA